MIYKRTPCLFHFDFGLIIGEVNVARPGHVHVAIAVLVIRHNSKVNGPVATVLGQDIAALALEVDHLLVKRVVMRVAIDAARCRASTLPRARRQHVAARVVVVGAAVAHLLAMGVARAHGIWWLAVPVLTWAALVALGSIGASPTQRVLLMRTWAVQYTIVELVHFAAQFQRESGYNPFR